MLTKKIPESNLDSTDLETFEPDVHVYPSLTVYGIVYTAHLITSHCWCHPRKTFMNPITGASVWTHNDVMSS